MPELLTDKDKKFVRWCHNGASIFSVCSGAQYMAVVVDIHGRVIGTGYNGAPSGMQNCVDGGCPHAVSGTRGDYSDCVAIHAEENAINSSDRADRHGGTIYVNGKPCWQCAKSIAGSGIRRLVYLDESVARLGVDQGLELMGTAGMELVACPADVVVNG